MSIPAEEPRDPYAPRPIDQPTDVPLGPDADLTVLDEAKVLAAPADPADRPRWRAAIRRWRDEARDRTSYDGSYYDAPETAWAATAWNVAMVWLWDEAVRDWEAERFDVVRLLSAYQRFGGLDAVVLWHAYPVIGIDSRNQFDWYDVPGLVELVAELHSAGVRVFLDYNPWDVGTRRSDLCDADMLAELVERVGADGVFLDTLKEGDPELLNTLTKASPRPVLEGESRVPLGRIQDHQASWAQWFADSPTPGVLRARWFEQRHMMHHTRRWNRDHGDELRSAWVNAAGVLLWDVVFGVRVDWSTRDLATVAAMRRVYRELTPFFTEGEWEPLTDLAPEATAAGLAGSCWRLGGAELYTLANPTGTTYEGPLLPDAPGELVPVLGEGIVPPGGLVGLVRVLDGSSDPDGLGAFRDTPPHRLPARAKPQAPPAAERVQPAAAPGVPADGAVRLEPGERVLTVRWRQRETGLYEQAPYVDDWKPLPPRLHQPREAERRVRVGAVAVDRSEVTNADFAAFLEDTGYRPKVAHRFLAHWRDRGPVPGTEREPVRYVDLDDARAYARWRRARLPTEDEWQCAAEHPDFDRREPLVWQWTESEHRDGRTRWGILKGGSWYAAEGSDWYLDGGPRDPSWSVRYLLTQAGTSRSETIGFRCAVDIREGT